MIEFDVDMGYLLECDELDKVVLRDENGEHEPMEFVPIAATVGAGTLTAEQVRECSKGVYFEGYSDGATHRVNGIEETDWQAIADKLNATLDAGTCHIEVHDNLAETEGMGDVWLECDECHWQMPLEPTTPRFKYCPNCGVKVVGG